MARSPSPRARAISPAKDESAPRKRRTPDEARRQILDAAQRLLAEHGPDAVGLKEVAKAAGVSHALVSHYFGTYDALVEAALHAHMLATRAETLRRIADVANAGPAEWVDLCFEQLAHPLSGRLVAWAILSGRMDSEDFFPRRDQGTKLVADAIEARMRAEHVEGAPRLTRDDVEAAILLVFTSALGYSIARGVLWSSLSRAPSAERDRAFREHLAQLVTARLSRGASAPTPKQQSKPESAAKPKSAAKKKR